MDLQRLRKGGRENGREGGRENGRRERVKKRMRREEGREREVESEGRVGGPKEKEGGKKREEVGGGRGRRREERRGKEGEGEKRQWKAERKVTKRLFDHNQDGWLTGGYRCLSTLLEIGW